MSKIHINKFLEDDKAILGKVVSGKLEEQIATLTAKVDYLYALWLKELQQNDLLRKQLEKYE